ncbi:MAG: hypothetical protein LBB18_00120 [Puniceicoccales bacterium]|nr:hypothetical protein [Puniceicoccales bacterium]
MVLVFFAIYAVGNLPEPMRPGSLSTRILLNVGSKVLLLVFLCFWRLKFFGAAFYVINAAMVFAVAFALEAENYSRFFERTDLAQSVFLANLCAIGFPLENPRCFMATFLIPYLVGNVILLSVGFMKEKECGEKAAHIENFYNFFFEDRVAAISTFIAMAFFIGTPPLQGMAWRVEFMEKVRGSGNLPWFVMFIVCLYSLGYVYFKWLLAIFQNKIIPKNIVWWRTFTPIRFLIAAGALITVTCRVFIP